MTSGTNLLLMFLTSDVMGTRGHLIRFTKRKIRTVLLTKNALKIDKASRIFKN